MGLSRYVGIWHLLPAAVAHEVGTRERVVWTSREGRGQCVTVKPFHAIVRFYRVDCVRHSSSNRRLVFSTGYLVSFATQR